jgi:hypothetical protein
MTDLGGAFPPPSPPPQGPPAGAPRSADGRFWWDGTHWLAVERPVAAPSPPPAGPWEPAAQGAVTSTGGTLLSQSQGTYQGFPSVDFLVSAQGEYIDYRVVLDGHSLYQVAVASTVNPPANFTSFASSLKILAP